MCSALTFLYKLHYFTDFSIMIAMVYCSLAHCCKYSSRPWQPSLQRQNAKMLVGIPASMGFLLKVLGYKKKNNLPLLEYLVFASSNETMLFNRDFIDDLSLS